jgi:hypothetical protein
MRANTGRSQVRCHRIALDNGEKRWKAKTPEQLALLKKSFEKGPYPPTGKDILLVHNNGLSQAQGKNWFALERVKVKRDGENPYTIVKQTDP